MARIAFENVSKVFPDGTRAVDDLGLEIPDGEFAVLVGPSGSGKSTALRMVAGLEDATRGTIRIGDRVVNDVPPKNRDIAMVFQNYALYPHMSVADNLGFALKMQGTVRDNIRSRVGGVASRLGLRDLLARRPRQLSGGQRQRVALGRAIVREPHAFLMDEPLSNLDAKLRVEMRAYLARLQHELGTTTLYVTHDQTEAMTMGDRVAVMNEGRLEQVAAPQELYDRPANVFVAAFIGSPAMNLLRARLENADGRLHVVLGDQRLALDDPAPTLRGHAGQEVIVGIRPEAFEPAAGATPGALLELPVLLRESLGADVLVHLQTEAPPVLSQEDLADPLAETNGDRPHGGRVTARLDPDVAGKPGDRLRLTVDTRRLHFFDPETERALRQLG
jgi:multiple sugar transport system ATP-binding protein